jgi:hypothetical protein
MTVCVGVAVHDCLVFAADSASTLIATDPATGRSTVHNVYRHGHKVFNLFKKQPIAAMTCGMGNFGSASISTLAKDLRHRLTNGAPPWRIDPAAYTIADVANKARRLLFDESYQAIQPPPPAPHSFEFWVGGYDSDRRTGHQVYKITIENGHCAPPDGVVINGGTGFFVGGQVAAINRLVTGLDEGLREELMRTGMADPVATQLVNHLRSKFQVQLLAPTMPIQDAIELADFLTGTTKAYYRFLPGADIVGGDTDLAVVTRHEGFKWIRRKHYYPAELNPLETDHV